MPSPDQPAAPMPTQAPLFPSPESPAAPTGSDEYYTPRDLLALVHEFWPDGIDVDPATCKLANKAVKAKTFYTLEDDGLNYLWLGRVWLNPPYPSPRRWVERLLDQHSITNRVTEALLLIPSATSERWFQRLYDHTILFFNRRLHFRKVDTEDCGSFDRPNALVYLGDRTGDFYRVFGDRGAIMARVPDPVHPASDGNPRFPRNPILSRSAAHPNHFRRILGQGGKECS